jgi:hypothetical protein
VQKFLKREGNITIGKKKKGNRQVEIPKPLA